MASLISKGTYEACFGQLKDKEIAASARLNWVQSGVLSRCLNTTFLSQGCSLEAASENGEDRWSTQPKDRRGSEKPLIARVSTQVPVVMSFG